MLGKTCNAPIWGRCAFGDVLADVIANVTTVAKYKRRVASLKFEAYV
jgi:hypothetical protein